MGWGRVCPDVSTPLQLPGIRQVARPHPCPSPPGRRGEEPDRSGHRRMKRAFLAWFAGLLAVAAVIAVGVRGWLGPSRGTTPSIVALMPPEGWSEAAWPFLNDQFGKGKAFECAKSACGDAIIVTFRAKIGFCNCATGVADDEELERVGDVGMIGEKFTPLAEGNEIRVGAMNGRSRAYNVEKDGGAAGILSLAFNERCDVIVATARSPTAKPLDIEGVALKFLRSPWVARWAELTLGL